MKSEEVKFLLEVAKLAAARSKAVRLKVGAVVTDAKGNLVATGYNGTVNGMDNTCELRDYPNEHEHSGSYYEMVHKYPLVDESGDNYRLVTDEASVIHAEQNLIAHAARRGISIDGGTVFLTHSSCSKCAGLLIQAGIQEVVYLEEYRLHQGIKVKYGNKIKFTHYNERHATI